MRLSKSAYEPLDKRDLHQSQVERYSAWLRLQPGYKATHRRQIGCNCFGITRPQSVSELLENGWIIARHQSSLFP
jgi:hypothetical protein